MFRDKTDCKPGKGGATGKARNDRSRLYKHDNRLVEQYFTHGHLIEDGLRFSVKREPGVVNFVPFLSLWWNKALYKDTRVEDEVSSHSPSPSSPVSSGLCPLRLLYTQSPLPQVE